jgi:hypothetical protein
MKRFYFIPILILIFSASCITATAQESKVRALFVLKFVENVLWPNEKKALIIGVIGKEEVFDELQARLQAKNPNGITVKKITASEAATCDVVYIASSVNNAITGISSLNKEILIITEADLSRRGSGISFVEDNGRLTFIVNKNAIEEKGLKISGSLLSLGKQA